MADNNSADLQAKTASTTSDDKAFAEIARQLYDLMVEDNSSINQIKSARCQLAFIYHSNKNEPEKNADKIMMAINQEYHNRISKLQPDIIICNGHPSKMTGGKVEEGLSSTTVLLPCYNLIKRYGSNNNRGLLLDGMITCSMCFDRSHGAVAVYSIELQLGRLLIDMGHPFMIRCTMSYDGESTSSMSIKIRYNNKSTDHNMMRVLPDYHYFYRAGDIRVVKIMVEQDDKNHHPKNLVVCTDSEINKLLDEPDYKYKSCSIQYELRRLIAMEAFAGLDGILIRNNCRFDKFQDPLQVKLIDAIICEYRKGIDMNHGSLQGKMIVVYVDSRDEHDYPQHTRRSWHRKTSHHLASSRMYFEGCKRVEIISVHCRDPSQSNLPEYFSDPVDNYIEKALAKIFDWYDAFEVRR